MPERLGLSTCRIMINTSAVDPTASFNRFGPNSNTDSFSLNGLDPPVFSVPLLELEQPKLGF